MKELQRKQRMRELLYSWPSLVVVTIIAILLAKGAAGVMIKERQSADRVKVLEREAENLEKRGGELEENIARLATEEGVREEIREKFSVTEEGEYVAIIVDEKKTASSTEKTASERLKRWWEIITSWSRD